MNNIPFLLLLLSTFLSCTTSSVQKPVKERLWYRQATEDWLSALPVGNGRLGAMVYGQANAAHLQLNEESLWAGVPENPYPPDVRRHYAKFQELNLQGAFDEALAYGMEHLVVAPTSIRSYEPLGDLYIKLDQANDVSNYSRSLELEKGIVQVRYEIDGKKYVQESFVSADYDVVVFHFQSLDGVPVDATIAYERQEDVQVSMQEDQIHVMGQVYDDPDARDDNPGGSGEPGYHMKFAARLGVKTDRQIVKSGQQLSIPGAIEFTIILSAATDYNPDQMNFDRRIDAIEIAAQKLNTALNTTYTKIRDQHIQTHSSVYNRVALKLRDIMPDTIPTDTRLENLKHGVDDPYLTQLLFQYGRYLLMGSGGFQARLPANLQGVWNKDMWAAWESDYHININLQMNYWPADVCNLSETMIPLSDFMVRLAERGKETAKQYIGSEGWVAHHATNIFGRTVPNGSTAASQLNNGYCSPLMGAWMSLTFWRHYEFNLDSTYLRTTAYPLIVGASRFILDFLKENEEGYLVTAPSYSPENSYINPSTGSELRNTVAASMDLQIINELFAATIAAEKILGLKNGLTDKLEAALGKLPAANRIGANGTLMEWIEDYEEAEPGHRHISHLFGLHPGTQITSDTPELLEAARKTLERRLSFGGGQTGWSRAWMVNFFARLHDGETCHQNINALMSELMTSSLLDLHPPRVFQIDGNLGVTAGIAEMLLQSHHGTIELLPALPKAWANGYVKGLKARGGLEIAIEWEDSQLKQVNIMAQKGYQGTLTYRGQDLPIDLIAGANMIFSELDFSKE